MAMLKVRCPNYLVIVFPSSKQSSQRDIPPSSELGNLEFLIHISRIRRTLRIGNFVTVGMNIPLWELYLNVVKLD